MPSKLRFIIIVLFALYTSTSFSQELRINEVLSSNISGITDSYGDYSDWIEIYNTTDSSINLADYYLSDKIDNPLKWQFPETILSSKSYILVFASENENTETELHANFRLSISGEKIMLSNTTGDIISQIDSVLFKDDVSYGYHSIEAPSYRYFGIPTPGAENNTDAYTGVLGEPLLNLPSGFYAETISLNASTEDVGSEIRYTLDGTEPNSSSPLFENGLQLQNNASEPNVVSLIPTNPSFDYPMPGFDSARAATRGWLEPYGHVNKTNILKVRTFKEGYLPGNTVTATYFINEEINNRYSLPVLSITTDHANLFDDEIGIYVYGTTGELGNYSEEGDEWERPTLVQFFENDGSLAFEQKLGVRIHGAGGRHSAIKNLRMYARSEYGNNMLNYQWFANDETDKFERFLVRGPGHRPDCAPRDDLADLLVQNLNMDIQHIRHVIVFINGEYWGIHTIKERFDQEYLERKYGKDEDDYVILRNSGILDSGQEGDETPFQNLLDYVEANDMSLDENYTYIKDYIDLNNYLTYFTSEVFLGNVDWVDTNIKFWRYKKGLEKSSNINGLDGKWRWFLYDFDLTFGSSCDDVSPFVNMLEKAFDPNGGRSTLLARNLKNNNLFKNDFINRMCDLINSNFSAKNINDKIDEIDQIMTVEMQEHTERWRYPSVASTLEDRLYEVPSLTKWNSTIENLHGYTLNRKRKIIDHMKAEFALEDTLQIQLDVNDKMMGNIQVNSILISENLDGVSENVYPWFGTYFINIPIQLIAAPKLGYRFVEWQENGSSQDTLNLNLIEGANYTAVFEKNPDFVFDDALFINEFMASNNNSLSDSYGASADWIEIYNPNENDVNLASYYISDNAGIPYKYQFPIGSDTTIIPAYGFKIIWADDRTERGALHTNFKLSADGEEIILLAPDSSLVDEISFGPQTEDVSFGREKDGDQAWIFFELPMGPTPGVSNNTTNLDDIEFYKTGLLYPNPVSRGKKVFLKEKMNIEIYNAVGQLVFAGQELSQIETNTFNRGIYFIKTEKNNILKLIIE